LLFRALRDDENDALSSKGLRVNESFIPLDSIVIHEPHNPFKGVVG